MSDYIHKSHNVTVLMYHIVFPAKYRRAVIDEQVDTVLKEICLGISERYQVKFLEIGTDKDHAHFLVQSVPTYSVTKIVRMVKNGARDFSPLSSSQETTVGVENFGRMVISQAPLVNMVIKRR